MDEIIILKRAIEKSGFRKKFIAKKCGFTPSQLSHILSGKRKYPERRQKILRFLSL